MKIEQFLRKFAFKAIPAVPTDSATTPEELYDKCISLTCPNNQTVTDAIIGWHKLLTRYVNKEGAILLSRLYESTKDSTGDWNNRRNSLTISENYSYAFCSNHFPRLILIMALNGFVPDDDDFWNMMVTERKFYLSSLFGMAPIERRISGFETKPYNARCYALGWYLAHIVSVVDMPYRGCSSLDIKNIFALGEEKDWKYDTALGCIARRNSETLDENEKKMAVAHFLRLVDPINYFLVPNQTNVVYKKVNKSDKTPLGENNFVVQYMLCRAYERFGNTLVDFLDVALADFDIQEIYSQYSRIANSKISANFAVNINLPATATASKSAIKKSSASTGISSKNDNKTLVFKLLSDLVDGGKMTPELVMKLSDNGFTQRTFGIASTYSLLVKERDFTRLGCNDKKYYNPERLIIDGEKYRVCSQWIPERIEKLKAWYNNL